MISWFFIAGAALAAEPTLAPLTEAIGAADARFEEPLMLVVEARDAGRALEALRPALVGVDFRPVLTRPKPREPRAAEQFVQEQLAVYSWPCGLVASYAEGAWRLVGVGECADVSVNHSAQAIAAETGGEALAWQMSPRGAVFGGLTGGILGLVVGDALVPEPPPCTEFCIDLGIPTVPKGAAPGLLIGGVSGALLGAAVVGRSEAKRELSVAPSVGPEGAGVSVTVRR